MENTDKLNAGSLFVEF